MPSFLFSPGLLIDFRIQYLLEWDFQGCSPPTASAGVTLVIITRQWCSIAGVLIYWGQIRNKFYFFFYILKIPQVAKRPQVV